MDKRTVTFVMAATMVWLGWILVVGPRFFPQPKRNAPPAAEPVQQPHPAERPDAAPEAPAQREAAHDGQAAAQPGAPEAPKAAARDVANQPPAAPPPARAEPALENDLVLGPASLKDAQGFEMRVVLTNHGAAVRAIDLAKYSSEDRKGPLKLIDPDVSPDVDSFLLTLQQVVESGKRSDGRALPNLAARNWEVVRHSHKEVVFQTTVDELDGLIVTKRFALEPGSYKLSFSVGWQLPAGAKPRELTYRLQTANGLPLEGDWYAVSFREAVIGADKGGAIQRKSWSAAKIAETFDKEDEAESWENTTIRYAGVDCQYFAVVAAPQQTLEDPWIASGQTMLVEEAREKKWSDVSYALTSREFALRAGGPQVVHQYSIFAGPKDPQLMHSAIPEPDLASLMNYGLFGWVSKRMVWLLKFFHGVVGNWGLSILILTVLVRSAMFPLSRKQAVASQKMQAKMQKLQPEIKELREKYKNDLQKFNQAQWELMKKHGVNPFAQLGGCLPMLIQFPIFLGLYWGLRMSIDLRQAPLIPGLGWCSDLSAPDMLWHFPPFLATFFQGWHGFFGILNLGPYLNVLPIVTVAIFLVQQKLFMPPATDENAEKMQKMMSWMMPLMGLLFYKVPSGLCLYFIASSLWGIAERKLKPKAKDQAPAAAAERRRKKKDRPLIPTRGAR